MPYGGPDYKGILDFVLGGGGGSPIFVNSHMEFWLWFPDISGLRVWDVLKWDIRALASGFSLGFTV